MTTKNQTAWNLYFRYNEFWDGAKMSFFQSGKKAKGKSQVLSKLGSV